MLLIVNVASNAGLRCNMPGSRHYIVYGIRLVWRTLVFPPTISKRQELDSNDEIAVLWSLTYDVTFRSLAKLVSGG